MGFLDRLFGSEQQPAAPTAAQTPPAYAQTPGRAAASPPPSEDEQAIARYRYLLRTAPPETIEQVHAEAFARLTDAQRQQVLADMSKELPPAERPRSDSPDDMARAATRAEYMNPGFLERSLGSPSAAGRPASPGLGAMLGTSVLGAVIGSVVGSALVSAFVAPAIAADAPPADAATDAVADVPTADAAVADAPATDAGGFGDASGFGGFGDFGGDFGF